MALPGIPIPETQCIGDSLFSINNALTALDASVIELISAGASVTVQETPPSGASAGDLWFDSSSGILSVYYDSQWVDVGAGGGGSLTDVTGTSPITVTGTDVKNVSLGAVVPSNLGGAGTVNGILKANGSGTVSAAVAGTDYLTSATLGSSPAAAKAWVNFNGVTAGVATITNDYKVSSVANLATGRYQVNFDSGTLTSNNYAVAITGSYPSGGVGACVVGFESMAGIYNTATPALKTTSSLQFEFSNNDSASYTEVQTGNVIIFGT